MGLLQTLGLTRAPKVPAVGGPTAPVPIVSPIEYGAVGSTYHGIMPLAAPNAQIGAYDVPWSVPTAVAGVYPGPQLFCGVESLRRQYLTLGYGPAPFFQQTIRPGVASLNMTTLDGKRPGMGLGPAGVAQAFGRLRQQRAHAQDALANQLLGW